MFYLILRFLFCLLELFKFSTCSVRTPCIPRLSLPSLPLPLSSPQLPFSRTRSALVRLPLSPVPRRLAPQRPTVASRLVSRF